jgi:hypothetical protein
MLGKHQYLENATAKYKIKMEKKVKKESYLPF